MRALALNLIKYRLCGKSVARRLRTRVKFERIDVYHREKLLSFRSLQEPFLHRYVNNEKKILQTFECIWNLHIVLINIPDKLFEIRSMR